MSIENNQATETNTNPHAGSDPFSEGGAPVPVHPSEVEPQEPREGEEHPDNGEENDEDNDHEDGEGDEGGEGGEQPANTSTNDRSYVQFYETVTAPVSVAGKDYQFTDPSDIRTLIEQAIELSMKEGQFAKGSVYQTLIDNAGIDDKSLRALIDVFKGDKAAILHFANKAGVDVSDLVDDEGSTDYTPKTAAVSPQQQAFNTALDTVRNAGAVGQPVWQFMNSLNESDVQLLFKNVNDIYILLDHARKGIFQKVIQGIDQLKLTRRLDTSKGMLAAYNEVFGMLVNAGAFAQGQEVKPTVIKPPQVQVPNAQRRGGVGEVRSVPPTRRTTKKKGLTISEIHKIKDPAEFQRELSNFLAKNKA